jgi:hypothetical protein
MLLSKHDRYNPKSNIAYLEGESCLVNLAGDYRYLTTGYYSSQDLECDGKTVYPTCKEIRQRAGHCFCTSVTATVPPRPYRATTPTAPAWLRMVKDKVKITV